MEAAEKLFKSYCDAKEALKYRIFSVDKPIIEYNSLNLNKKENEELGYYSIDLEASIASAVKERNQNEIEKLILRLIRDIEKNRVNPDLAIACINSIRDTLFAIPASMGYDPNEILTGNYVELYNELSLKINIFDMGKYLISVSNSIIKGLDGKIGNKYKQLIDEVKKYVVNHVGEDISLAFVANKFGISTTHLSNIFKLETGDNFIKFVLSIKMEIACKLITETNMSIAEISQNTGYFNENSFYNAFKKHTGLTPNQYRMECVRKNIL